MIGDRIVCRDALRTSKCLSLSEKLSLDPAVDFLSVALF